MTEIVKDIDFFNFLEENLKIQNKCLPETKAYINSIFVKHLNCPEDFSKKSIILEFAQAKNSYSFTRFQEIGDGLLYGLSLFPDYFKNQSEDYYITIGRNSYYKCFKILNKKWLLFEELSDNFDTFIYSIKSNSVFK